MTTKIDWKQSPTGEEETEIWEVYLKDQPQGLQSGHWPVLRVTKPFHQPWKYWADLDGQGSREVLFAQLSRINHTHEEAKRDLIGWVLEEIEKGRADPSLKAVLDMLRKPEKPA